MNNKKKLKDVLETVEAKSIDGRLDIDICGVATDSKKVKDGFVFIAVKGSRYDGHNFIKEAIDAGAAAIIAEQDFSGLAPAERITKVISSDSRKAAAVIIHNFYGRPAEKMKVIGITGTNGKTTISYLAENILKCAGFHPGVVGTVNYRYGSRQIPATNTTPGALQLVELLHYMAANGADYLVMEVSSHSLEQGRVSGIDFKTAVFTNITPEHLDYHKNMREYKKAKAILFEGLSKYSTAVLNIDDDFGRELQKVVKSVKLTYGFGGKADIMPEKVFMSPDGTRLTVKTPKGSLKLFSKLVGKFNIYNIIASLGIGLAEGVGLKDIASGIEAVKVVPGRLEEISCGQPFKVYVDYAHTDDALKNVLVTLRELAPRRIITLFGCGGNRDTAKRPRMGKAASQLSDYIIITTDNPRNEDPGLIAGQVMEGVVREKLNRSSVILDRQEAINKAIEEAGPGDIVLLAGKGHETYQIFESMVLPFDDREIVKKALFKRGYNLICLA